MNTDKLFTKNTLLLIPLGIAVNFIGAQTALLFELPLFLDSIGTILAAALGGYLPGVVVGFFSNAINSVSDPITLYYGLLSVLIAILASMMSERGVFTRPLSTALSSLCFAFIGGVLGSVMTWTLYGFNFGYGISEPYAQYLYDSTGMGKFWAQFVADVGIDIGDKLIAMFIVYFVLKAIPSRWLRRMPLGKVYREYRANAAYQKRSEARERGEQPSASAKEREDTGARGVFRQRKTLRNTVAKLIILTSVILGALAVTIGYVIYSNTMNARYADLCGSAVDLMLIELKTADIEKYLQTSEKDETYERIKTRLYEIRDCIPDIEYMYVYDVREDGCHVVFDLDTEEVEGNDLGSFVEHDDGFADVREALLAGEEIAPKITRGYFGWLLTVYKPIVQNGECVAYACADIDMENVVSDRYVFVIRILSLMFGAAIIIIAFSVWFAQRRLVAPINSLASATGKLAYDSEERRQRNIERLDKLDIKTGDEIENLYHAIKKTTGDVSAYISLTDEQSREVAQKAKLIQRMQNNIINSFANMVENRDQNTGSHIKRTAAYVSIIARKLSDDSKYQAQLTESRIDDLYRSAPLHDIGKIRISDTLLNKPGKLTPEEFEEMKTHTTEGGEILRSCLEGIEGDSYLTTAIELATGHHERWNGKGYPYGLAGDEIPLSARIMALADVFDALISRRSYKEPLSFERAVEIVCEERGEHFDPDVVDAFLASLDDIKEIALKY